MGLQLTIHPLWDSTWTSCKLGKCPTHSIILCSAPKHIPLYKYKIVGLEYGRGLDVPPCEITDSSTLATKIFSIVPGNKCVGHHSQEIQPPVGNAAITISPVTTTITHVVATIKSTSPGQHMTKHHNSRSINSREHHNLICSPWFVLQSPQPGLHTIPGHHNNSEGKGEAGRAVYKKFSEST